MSASSFQLLEQLVWHFFNMYFLQADDEHSDWPGPEPGLSVMQLTDEEIDPEISFSQVSWWRLGLNSKPVIAAPCWTSSQKVSRATSQIWHQETEVSGSCRSFVWSSFHCWCHHMTHMATLSGGSGMGAHPVVLAYSEQVNFKMELT